MNAAYFSRTPLGRALLHAACLCRQPGAARFFLTGLARNLRQLVQAPRPPVAKSMEKTIMRNKKLVIPLLAVVAFAVACKPSEEKTATQQLDSVKQ
jgi:hypothetical protein